MMREWWQTLIWKGALLVALSATYGLIAEWASHRRPLGRLANGVAFGLVAVLVMATRCIWSRGSSTTGGPW
ncbi:MAG TPA: hypothetical protein PLQ97_09960 [Myxococcota bacterium]|nr:hypothetical protein [Myxococcota bacterium]HQK51203.1 hypothetical protein [Myxococcota bacterium]